MSGHGLVRAKKPHQDFLLPLEIFNQGGRVRVQMVGFLFGESTHYGDRAIHTHYSLTIIFCHFHSPPLPFFPPSTAAI
jgi:hypothetical protein